MVPEDETLEEHMDAILCTMALLCIEVGFDEVSSLFLNLVVRRINFTDLVALVECFFSGYDFTVLKKKYTSGSAFFRLLHRPLFLIIKLHFK